MGVHDEGGATGLARRMLGGSKWIFPSSRNPGQHVMRLNGAHDRVCAAGSKAGVAFTFVLYDFRQHADFLIMPTLAA
jgi:hypothetical protein